MTHTKGPWQIVAIRDPGFLGVAEVDGPVIAEITEWGSGGKYDLEEATANAKLIVAAPELLEALDYIATEGSDCPPNTEPAEFYRNQLLACIGRAARAIAKVEGR